RVLGSSGAACARRATRGVRATPSTGPWPAGSARAGGDRPALRQVRPGRDGPGLPPPTALAVHFGAVTRPNFSAGLRTCTDIAASAGPLPSRAGDPPAWPELGLTGELKRWPVPQERASVAGPPSRQRSGRGKHRPGQPEGESMSTLRKIAEIPAGSWTKWLVVGFWVAVLAVAFPLSTKLKGAEKNDTSQWVPAGAESTK